MLFGKNIITSKGDRIIMTVKNLFYLANEGTLMKPLLLIFILHQTTCIIHTILGMLIEHQFESPFFTFYVKMESILESAAVWKEVSMKK